MVTVSEHENVAVAEMLRSCCVTVSEHENVAVTVKSVHGISLFF